MKKRFCPGRITVSPFLHILVTFRFLLFSFAILERLFCQKFEQREFCFVTDQKGHGIPDSLMKEVKNLTRKFFHLPYEEKLKIKMTPATGYRSTGIYTHLYI